MSSEMIRIAIDTHLAQARAGRTFPQNMLPGIEADLRAVERIVAEYDKKLSDAQVSGVYTQRGFDEQRKELQTKAVAQLAPTLQKVDGLRDRVRTTISAAAAAAAASAGVTDATERLIRESREQELRALLRDSDPLEVQAWYLDAAATGDNELLVAAVEHAPRAPYQIHGGTKTLGKFELVTADVRKQGDALKIQRLALASPELESLTGLAALYETFVHMAHQAVGHRPDGDPIAATARALAGATS